MDKKTTIDFTKLSDGELETLLRDVKSEQQRRVEAAQIKKNTALVQQSVDNGTLVDDIMEGVSDYWDSMYMDMVHDYLIGAFPDSESLQKEAKACLELAGDLSNTRDEIQRGKCDEDEEEEYEHDCTKLQTRLTKLVAQIKK